LFCGIAAEALVFGVPTRLMQMMRRSTKPRGALLTIVSLRDSPIRVKKFYER